MNVPDLPKHLTRRRVLAAVAGGFGVLGWFGMDPMGNVTPESPPYDLDEDGLFEDVNGDGTFDHRDPLMYSHESREEFASEAVPSAFNYAYPDDRSDSIALVNYVWSGDRDGLWTPDGDPLDLAFYVSPAVAEPGAEQARQHTMSALNNASIRTAGDWYADIGVQEVVELDEASYALESSMEAVVDEVDEIAATVEETVTDSAEYTDAGLGVILLDGGDPAAFLAADGSYAVVTGMQEIGEYPGTPLFTQNRADVVPARGAAGVLGLEPTLQSMLAADDEFGGEVYSITGPAYTKSIEAQQESMERRNVTPPDDSLLTETRFAKDTYTSVFSTYALDNWQPEILEPQ